VRRFSADEWAVVMDALAAQVGHAAALLEGELVPEVAGDVRVVGLDLLPGAGEVQPRCSCPDWADPCKHAAAVCYLVADELDRDPFLLFLLRGKSREELLAGVRHRRGWGSGRPEAMADLDDDTLAGGWQVDAGVAAREAWAAPERSGPATVAIPAPPRHPGRPLLVLDMAPPGSGVDTAVLLALAADAARRAWALATGSAAPELELSFDEDCARWAASTVEGIAAPVGFDELARRAGVSRRELFLRALAWRTGGRGGLAALLEPWQPSPSDLAPGRAELGARSRVSANRVSLGDRQLRLGRDRKWYRYRKVRGAWQPEAEAVLPD
jgi:SWIM zinc finger